MTQMASLDRIARARSRSAHLSAMADNSSKPIELYQIPHAATRRPQGRPCQ